MSKPFSRLRRSRKGRRLALGVRGEAQWTREKPVVEPVKVHTGPRGRIIDLKTGVQINKGRYHLARQDGRVVYLGKQLNLFGKEIDLYVRVKRSPPVRSPLGKQGLMTARTRGYNVRKPGNTQLELVY